MSKRKYGQMSGGSGYEPPKKKMKKQQSKISLFQVTKKSVEFKQVDVPQATYALNTTGVVTLLNGLEQGTFSYNMIGRKITMKSVALDWRVQFIRANGNIDSGRFAIIYDTQPNGMIPTIATIFQDVDFGGTTSTNSMSGINLDNGDRFRVISDRRLVLPLITDVATQALAFPSDKNDLGGNVWRKISLETTYNDNQAGDITTITSGALYLVTFGDTVAGSEAFGLRAKTRIRFTDM